MHAEQVHLCGRLTPKEYSMESSVGDDLHAARVLLSEQNVVDTRRFGLAKRVVMRGSRMFTHRLVTASGRLADAVQAVDQERLEAVSEVRSELAAAREETREMRDSLTGLIGQVEDRLAEHQQILARVDTLSAQADVANIALAKLEAAVTSLRSQLDFAEKVSAHQRGELRRAQTQIGRLSRNAEATDQAQENRVAASLVADVADPLDEQGYLDFEERFRGSREEIHHRQLDALKFVEGLEPSKGPLLDIACGRGEWLDILRSANIEAYGVDTNAAMIADAIGNGLDVRNEDALTHLASLEDSSLQGISAFHFVEHIPLGTLVGMLDDSLLALKPDGILLLETPNPTNFMVGSATFYLDPTHLRPIHPELLRFLVESRGFADVQIHYVHPAIPANVLVEAGPADGYPDERLNRVVGAVETFVFGAQDYVLTARRPADVNPTAAVSPES